MTKLEPTKETLRSRIADEMADSLDEELEMEIDDKRLDEYLTECSGYPELNAIDRRLYFAELLRLQGELVKLQDWVQHKKQKVAVIFEGRDAAGKGGVIKRITQRLNPRICRVAALPAPNEPSVHNGISSGMPRTFLPAGKSSFSTEAGTIALASNG